MSTSQMTTSNQMTQEDRRADKTNTIVGMAMGCVLVGVGGYVLLQNMASVKLPDSNEAWASTWNKKLSKNWEMPKPEGGIDWSDPKNDPNKLAQQPWAQPNPLFEQVRDHQVVPTNFGRH
jgi:hypothetical protein